MLFSSEKDKQKFLEQCYSRGLKLVKWKYWMPSSQENVYTPEDITTNAVISFAPKLDTIEFESTNHAFYYFKYHLLNSASTYKRKFKRDLSLDAPIAAESSETFGSLIASHSIYPSLEAEEYTESITQVVDRMTNREQRELIQLIWIQGKAIAEVAKQKRTTDKYIVRSLNRIKLKLGRHLSFVKEKQS